MGSGRNELAEIVDSFTSNWLDYQESFSLSKFYLAVLGR